MLAAAVLERFLAEREHGEERRDRALLWILALPQLLWRKPWYSKRRPVVTVPVAGADLGAEGLTTVWENFTSTHIDLFEYSVRHWGGP